MEKSVVTGVLVKNLQGELLDILYKEMYIYCMSNVLSISDARANLPTIVDKVSNNLSRVTITVNGHPKAVLLSAEEMEALEETAEVLSIPGAKKSITEGLRQAKKGEGTTLSSLK